MTGQLLGNLSSCHSGSCHSGVSQPGVSLMTKQRVRISIDSPNSSTDSLGSAPRVEPQDEPEERGEGSHFTYPPFKSKQDTGSDTKGHAETGSSHSVPSQSGSQTQKKQKNVVLVLCKDFVKSQLGWVIPHLNWTSSRAVIRSAFSALIGVILLVDPKSFHAIGAVPVFLLIVAMLCPPYQSINRHLEVVLCSVFMLCSAWAYCVIGIRIAWLVRQNTPLHDQAEFVRYLGENGLTTLNVFEGKFLDTRVSVVCAAWLCLGLGLLTWLKAVLGPGIFTSGNILSTIIIAITFTNVQLFPYPFYLFPWSLLRPCFSQLAVSLACSILILPETLTHQFSSQLSSVLANLSTILRLQRDMLESPPSTTTWDELFDLETPLSAAGLGVGGLSLTEESFKREISYGRWNGKKLKKLVTEIRTLVGRTNNFLIFQNIVSLRIRKGGVTIADSILPESRRSGTSTPVHEAFSEESRASSRSSIHSLADEVSHHPRGSHNFLRGLLIMNAPKPVGVIESQRYMDLENSLTNAADEIHLDELVLLLLLATRDLTTSLQDGVKRLIEVCGHMRSVGLNPFRTKYDRNKQLKISEDMLANMKRVLQDFKDSGRLKILDPYHSLFEPIPAKRRRNAPSHRAIYLAYLYEYGLIRWAESFISLFEKVLEVEKTTEKRKLWLPGLNKKAFSKAVSQMIVDDEDPNQVPGLQPTYITASRDPDILPPRTLGHQVGAIIYTFIQHLIKREVIFGLKVTALVIVVSVPAYLKSTVTFFNHQRGVWVLIMAAVSSGQFVGDTIFSFIQRIIGTLLGAAFGLLIWYTGNGKGNGNKYGTVFASAVFFIPLFYYRIYFPVPVTAILGSITTTLVLGYSWQDGQHPSTIDNGANFGVGWEIAWRRFVAVAIGVTAAFIWAYVPPSNTSKHFLRRGLGKVIQETGRYFCAAVSFLKCQEEAGPIPSILQTNWVALRAKLRSLSLIKKYISYELSIRGDWPEETYKELELLSRSLLDTNQIFLDVAASLPKVWREALLNRIRFSDPNFLSDITGVFFELSVALKTATPLPQYYNPLFESFAQIQYGYAVELTPEGMPKHLDMETIQSMDYVKFSVATSYASSMVNKLDRIMLVVKTLCGEDYRFQLDRTDEDRALLGNHSEDSLV